MLAQHEAPTEQNFFQLFNLVRAKESSLTSGDSFLNKKVPHDKPLAAHISPQKQFTCFMLKLDTVQIIVGLFVMSSGRTHLANIAFCLGDNGSFPHLSLDFREKKSRNKSIAVQKSFPCYVQSYVYLVDGAKYAQSNYKAVKQVQGTLFLSL